MSFLTRLEYLMKKNGISNKAELAKISGIPYTTIDGFYKKGTDNIKLSTLMKLTACLHCSLDFLVDDVKGTTLAAHFEGENFTEEELAEIDNFVAFVKNKRK
ncbi:MAG: helix-turn-helix transcriptional regulator [Sarcina sp.]|nr:helix-turn-helix transcriptional regulator [Sarcina sp.]